MTGTFSLTSLQTCFFFLSFSLISSTPTIQTLPHVVQRATNWDDIPHTFTSVYNVTSDACASSLRFRSSPSVDTRNIGRLPLSEIFESDSAFQCAGTSSMILVTQIAVLVPGSLANVGLSSFQTAIDTNGNANAIARNSNNSAMLVGWHGGTRACGASLYDETNTIFFFVNEAQGFAIDFSRDQGSTTDRVRIAQDVRALLVVPGKGPGICLYVDLNSGSSSSGGRRDGMVTLQINNGQAIDLTSGLQQNNNNSNTDDNETTNNDNENNNSIDDTPSPQNNDDDNNNSASSSTTTNNDENTASFSTEPIATELPSASPTDTGLPSQPPSTGDNNTPVTAPPLPPSSSGSSGDDEDDTTPEMSPESSSRGRGAACFPFDARVLPDVLISEVRPGDTLPLGGRVLFFTHSDRHIRSTFIRLTLSRRKTILASAGHFLYMSDGSLRTAGSIRAGVDALVLATSHMPMRVIATDVVSSIGLYNVQTEHGIMQIDDVIASTYTTAVEPGVAHRIVGNLATVMGQAEKWKSGMETRIGGIISKILTKGAPWIVDLLPKAGHTLHVVR